MIEEKFYVRLLFLKIICDTIVLQLLVCEVSEMPKSEDRATAGVKVLYSRVLAQRPMVKINGNVQYLSSGTSMIQAGGKVISLFENTWMRACGVGSLQADGSRKINKMGNIELIRDVDSERGAFDSAVITTIRTAIPEFETKSLKAFYEELMKITGEDASMVRRGVSSSLGKIAAEDLLLSGALSHYSPFFTQTTVGKAIRQKGIEKYGIIEIHEELDLTSKPVVVDYPQGSDPDFNALNDAHLPNNDLSKVQPSPQSPIYSHSISATEHETKQSESKADAPSQSSTHRSLSLLLNSPKPSEVETIINLECKTLTGNTFTEPCKPSETILAIKERIFKREGIPVEDQGIVLGSTGILLANDRLLSDYNYKKGPLRLVLRLNNQHLADAENVQPKPQPAPSSNCRFQLLCGISAALGAVALIIAFGVLNVATAGTAAGITLAVLGGIAFFGGGIGLASARCKNQSDERLLGRPN